MPIQVPPPTLSRQNSRASRSREERPSLQRRDSSRTRQALTYGLLVGSAITGAAAAPHRSRSNSPHRANLDMRGTDMLAAPMQASRAMEDAMAAMNLAHGHLEDLYGKESEAHQLLARQIIQEDSSGHVFIPAAPAINKPLPKPPQRPSSLQAPKNSPEPAKHSPEPAKPPQVAPAKPPQGQQPLQPPSSGRPSDTALFDGIPKSQNAIAVVWNGKYDATFHVYANSGPYQPGLGAPFKIVNVKAGSTANVELPTAFSGRVQLMSGSGKADDCATWAEVAFQQWQDLTFYDVSLIRGTNAGLSMRASDGSSKAEIPANIMQMAPDSIKVKDSGGAMVIKDTEGYDGSIKWDAIDWLHSTVKVSDAYARNFEDQATHSTKDNHMVFEFTV